VGLFLIRRTLISLMTIVIISMVVFGIVKSAPGDPYGELATNPSISPERIAELRDALGLNDPIPQQYVKWAGQYIQGDWGDCFSTCDRVAPYIFGRIPVTLAVIGSSFILSLLIAIPIGVISAFRQYSLFDQFATTFAFLGFSLPTFFTGTLLIYIFGIRLNDTPLELPFIFDRTVEGVWANIRQAIMPILVLGLASSAALTRFVRSSMLEVLGQDYIRTARAKGLKEQSVVILHGMRNGMIPVVTVIALQIPEVFGGAIITEQIFSVPGIGNALVSSIRASDNPVAISITLMIAILVVIFNVVADILYALLDPRIKLS
jgi:peptide/nickel transport system permease protein